MEQTNQKPLQKEKKPRSLGRTAGLIAGIAVGVLAAAYIAVCAAAAAGGTTLRGTQVLGVDVGGLTAQQVRDKWQREGDAACRKETIDLTLEDQVIGTVNLTELGGVRDAPGGGAGRLERGPRRQFLRQRLSPDPQLVRGHPGAGPVGPGRRAAVPAGRKPQPGAEP